MPPARRRSAYGSVGVAQSLRELPHLVAQLVAVAVPPPLDQLSKYDVLDRHLIPRSPIRCLRDQKRDRTAGLAGWPVGTTWRT